MTQREAAIVSAYTGYTLGSYFTMVEYIEEKLGHSVWDHQLVELRDEIKEKTEADFVALQVDKC